MNEAIARHVHSLAVTGGVLLAIVAIMWGVSREQRRMTATASLHQGGNTADSAQLVGVALGGWDDATWQPSGPDAAGASYSIENGLAIAGLAPDV